MNLTPQDLVKDGEISIDETLWASMNSSLTKDQIKQLISDAMDGIELPYRKISKEDMEKSFKELVEFDGMSLLKDEAFFSRYDYKYSNDLDLLTCSNVGNKASDYFHQVSRFRCDSINAPSPYRTWTQERFRLTLLNALWTLKFKKVDSAVLRSCIGLRKYIAAQHRPTVMKAMIDMFEAESVLDFSSGWGDRLAGFYASDAKKYTGIDPNESLIDGYRGQINAYSRLRGEVKDVTMICDGAENVTHNKEYDLVFTSPPYFNIERYTHEANQSFKKFRKIDAWLEGFMFVALDNAWNALNDGGTMTINISDVYSNHTINKICDPMNDYISSLPNAEYYGNIGYEMRKRPNSKALAGKTGKFAEPIWVWKKRGN